MGIELVATTDNIVMTRTFSKIHGLAALRIGWMFGPAAHRRRGEPHPRPLQRLDARRCAAAVAAIEDTAHLEHVEAHTEKWRNWLTEEIEKLGLKVTPSVANFVLIHFPTEQGQDRGGRRCVPHQTRARAARAGHYDLPHALRMTVGTEEANRLVVEALARLHGAKVAAT